MFLLVIVVGFSVWLIYQDFSESWHNQKLQKEMQSLYTSTPTPAPTVTLAPTLTPAPAETDPPETEPPETEPPGPVILPQFADLLAINPDVVAWINIPGTSIDYPVVQNDDNKYYLDHDIYGESSKAGTLFMDYRMTLNGDDRHQIIYGHHLRDGSMFTDLMKYKDQSFFSENRYIYLDQLYTQETWEIFSAYVTSTEFYYIETRFADDEDWLDFIKLFQDKSKFDTDIVMSADDQVLTLSTCTYEFDDARFVVHARRLPNANR